MYRSKKNPFVKSNSGTSKCHRIKNKVKVKLSEKKNSSVSIQSCYPRFQRNTLLESSTYSKHRLKNSW